MTENFDTDTRCPFCGHQHTKASKAYEAKAHIPPEDGDASMCIRCGEMAIFDASSPGGLREPTAEEQAAMDGDYEIERLRRAWRIMDKRRWQEGRGEPRRN